MFHTEISINHMLPGYEVCCKESVWETFSIQVSWWVCTWGYNGIMENKMETIIMENQMENKMENEMKTGGI